MSKQLTYRTKFGEDFLTLIKSRSPLAYVETTELTELRTNILNIQKVKSIARSVFYYTAEGSLTCLRWVGRNRCLYNDYRDNFNDQLPNKECTVEDFIRRLTSEPGTPDLSHTSIPDASIIIASGITSLLDDTRLCQSLIEAITNGYFNENRVILILTDVTIEMPVKLLKYSNPLFFGLPDEQELTEKFLQVRDEVVEELLSKKKGFNKTNYWFTKEDQYKEIIKATNGMTALEAAACYRICILNTQSISDTYTDLLPYIYKQKKRLIYNATALHFVPENELPDLQYIGGMKYPKYFLSIRAAAFHDESSGLELPKGIVLKGPTGCGKSMFAKATGKLLKLPVIALEMGSIFNAYTGVSENQIRQELERIDAFNGCVLLIDEADKAFAGSASDSGLDSGVVSRVFGIILKWLQERKSKTFVVLTINNDKDLPPELLRCGRFDKVFTIDLPTNDERKAIIATHLAKRGISLQFSPYEADKMLEATTNFSGAQLEAVVIESQYIAFSKRKDKQPTVTDIMEAISMIRS